MSAEPGVHGFSSFQDFTSLPVDCPRRVNACGCFCKPLYLKSKMFTLKLADGDKAKMAKFCSTMAIMIQNEPGHEK
jgi:hypothetical protein